MDARLDGDERMPAAKQRHQGDGDADARRNGCLRQVAGGQGRFRLHLPERPLPRVGRVRSLQGQDVPEPSGRRSRRTPGRHALGGFEEFRDQVTRRHQGQEVCAGTDRHRHPRHRHQLSRYRRPGWKVRRRQRLVERDEQLPQGRQARRMGLDRRRADAGGHGNRRFRPRPVHRYRQGARLHRVPEEKPVLR